MRKGTLLDYPFLLHYATFLGAFALTLRSFSGSRWTALLFVTALAGISDAVENALLLSLMGDLGALGPLAWLPVPVYLKFWAISLGACLAGITMVRLSRQRSGAKETPSRHPLRWGSIIGATTFTSGAAAALATLAPASFGFLLSSTIGVAWLAMLGFVGLLLAQRPTDQATPTAPA